ncbi:MAG TPA: RsmD family RNA methyltransferase, partial [Pedococcus sp.]
DVLDGAAVLDLYAGSGALGLEAASRGATSVVLVESDRAAAAVARRNAAQTGIPGISVRAATVERTLATAPPLPADLVFIDPPYDIGEDVLERVLTALVEQRWLSEEALVVVERSSRSPEPRWPSGLQAEGERRYGETRIWFAGVRDPDDVA